MIYGAAVAVGLATGSMMILFLVLTGRVSWRNKQTSEPLRNSPEQPSAPQQLVPVRMEFLEQLLLRGLGLQDQDETYVGTPTQVRGEEEVSDRLAWQDHQMPEAMQDSLVRERDTMAEQILRMQSSLLYQPEVAYQQESLDQSLDQNQASLVDEERYEF